MPAPFPLIKLGGILVKQISKPIANFAKDRAKSNPFFRTYVCMPPAQLYNWCEIKLKMWILNLGKPVNIPVLSEQMAIELGANLLGEGIVFAIAATALFTEYNRSAKKEAAKELARKDEINSLFHQLQDLYLRVEQQDAQLREIHRHVLNITQSNKTDETKTDRNIKEPPIPPSSPIILPVCNDIETHMNSFSVVNYAMHFVQNDLLNHEHDERENGIVTDALHYIENNVYRRTITV